MKNKFVSYVMIVLMVLASITMGFPRLEVFGEAEPAMPGYCMPEAEQSNGQILVLVMDENDWTEVGCLDFSRYLQDKELDMSSWVNTLQEMVTIRLVKKGGGAAHLDTVLFGGSQPVSVSGIDPSEQKKLYKKDFDVLPITEEGLELTFPTDRAGNLLAVCARIEDTVISQIPFHFPLDNAYKKISDASSFYTYRINSRNGSILIDGSIDEVEAVEPFVKEYVVPGSGHPSGYVYIWVMNDDKFLYTVFDFTPDNTMDGEKDYAGVYAKTPQGIKEFKVSVPEIVWGQPAFTYTENVSYQHKVYEFAIPLSEIVSDGDDSNDIMLAFAAYGTAAPLPGEFNPDITYDPDNNRFFTVYEKQIDWDKYIYGRFVDQKGKTLGDEVQISTTTDNGSIPSVVKAVYNEEPAYFTVWKGNKYSEYGTAIYGQFIHAGNGSLLGGPIQISDDDFIPGGGVDVAYDTTNRRCLVVWEDYRYPANDNEYRSYDIYGQLVNEDGTLNGNNFAICNNGIDGTGADQYEPAVSFDTVNQKYLVVWKDFRSFDTFDIYGQFVSVNGNMMGVNSKTNFVISNAPGNQDQPAAAYDGINERFLVVFHDYRNGGTNCDIYGQMVSAGSVMGDLLYKPGSQNFAICSENSHQEYPTIAFNSDSQRYLVAWEDSRTAPDSISIYGQMVEANGTLSPVNNNSTDNFPIVSLEGFQQTPSLAYNSMEKSFIAAYHYRGPYVTEYALVPPAVGFKAKVDYPSPGLPYAIATGDFNNDNLQDLVVTNGNTSNYSVYTNKGGGAFDVKRADENTIYHPLWVTTGRFNNDEYVDIAITSSATQGLTVFNGAGDSTFPDLTGYKSGTSPNTVVTSDFDSDGDLDLAVSNYHSQNVSIYFNSEGIFGVDSDNNGIFEPNSSYTVGNGPARMAVEDFNRDGYSDLAVVCGDDEAIYILLNDGSGSFKTPETPSFYGGTNPIGITAGDFNKDNNIDLAVTNFDTTFDFSGNVSIFWGEGNGSFTRVTNLTVNDGPIGIINADFNSDGNHDLAVANRYCNSVSVLLGNGLGGFVRQDFNVGEGPMNLISGDFNVDSNVDLAVVNYGEGSISILLNSAVTGEDTTAPGWTEGSNLTASNISSTGLTLTWTAATDNVGVAGYQIDMNGILQMVVTDVTYNFAGLLSDKTYTFTVKAYDSAGNWSTALKTTVTTLKEATDGEAPTWTEGSNLTASNISSTGLTLTWTAATDNVGVTGYKIYRNGSEIGSTEGNGSVYNITGLSQDTTYTFRVEACDSAGNWSTEGPSITVTTAKAQSGGSPSSGGGTVPDGIIVTPEGKVVTDNGITIEFPVNAVDSITRINISKVTNVSNLPIPEGGRFISDIFDLSKDRTGDFHKPVKLIIPFDANKVDKNAYTVGIYWLNEQNDQWVELENTNIDWDGGKVSGEVNHFAKFAVLAMEQDKPTNQKPEEVSVILTDIKGHWAEKDIKSLVEAGVVNGYNDNTFRPDNTITRAEFVTLLVKAFKLEAKNSRLFEDVASHWAKEDITTAAALKIVKGYSATNFGPDDYITREQMAAIMARAVKLLTPTSHELSFDDNGDISDWALDSVSAAVKNGIIRGYPDNTFRPQGNATRAEAVTIIARSLK